MDKEFLNEINTNDINLSSFNIHDELNPHVWEDFKMRSDVRLKLLAIAKDFIKDLDIPWVQIKDITLTGSMSNFNWSKYSDFDLHIILDYKDVGDKEELVSNYFNTKKNLWNETHDIQIYCYEVEVYVQNSTEPHMSSGVFSLKDGKWLVKPDLKKPVLNAPMIKEKAASIINNIEYAIEVFEAGEYEKVLKINDKIMDKIKLMRQQGLDSGGEFSYENIAFKVIRRSEYLDILREIKIKSYDLINSMGTQCDN